MARTLLITAAAGGALVLAGCGAGAAGSAGSSAGTAAASSADLTTSRSSLGTIVVDGTGRTVYAFDSDVPGSATSACTGTCVSLWPALTTTSSTPSVQGVTGEVGTAPTADGGRQVTLDGHRLYTFSGDSRSGQLNGEAFMNIWWVVSPAGQEVKKAAASSPSSSSSPSPAGGYSY